MKSGYSIYWTDHALEELTATIGYLTDRFTEQEVRNLVKKVENTTSLIAQNPSLYPKSDKKGIHRAVIQKYTTLYYRVRESRIEILSFFSNRQNPEKRKF